MFRCRAWPDRGHGSGCSIERRVVSTRSPSAARAKAIATRSRWNVQSRSKFAAVEQPTGPRLPGRRHHGQEGPPGSRRARRYCSLRSSLRAPPQGSRVVAGQAPRRRRRPPCNTSRGGTGQSTSLPPIVPGVRSRVRGSSSTATSVSQRTTTPSVCSFASLNAPITLLQWGDLESKWSMDRTLTPRDRKRSSASEASDPTTWTTKSLASTPARVVSDTNQRSASRWNRGSSSTTQEKIPLDRALLPASGGWWAGPSGRPGGLVTAHSTRAAADYGMVTRFDQAPRCRLRHRLRLEGTGFAATVTSGSGSPGVVGVVCTTDGPVPAMKCEMRPVPYQLT